jgi:hypothetical protein
LARAPGFFALWVPAWVAAVVRVVFVVLGPLGLLVEEE